MLMYFKSKKITQEACGERAGCTVFPKWNVFSVPAIHQRGKAFSEQEFQFRFQSVHLISTLYPYHIRLKLDM